MPYCEPVSKCYKDSQGEQRRAKVGLGQENKSIKKSNEWNLKCTFQTCKIKKVAFLTLKCFKQWQVMEDRQTFLSLELFLMNPKCPLSIFFSYSLFLAFCSSVQCSATQLCPTLLQPNGCSLPSSSVNGISQARILECVAISYSRGSSQPRDWTHVSCISCTGKQILHH